MDTVSLALALRREAATTNERRALVIAGERERGYDLLESVLDALSVGITETTLVGPDDRLRCEQVAQTGADELLGTTRELLVLDAHADLQPNALGMVVGAVDGGGLLILLTPPLEEWPDRRGRFSESMAVPPASLADVTGRFVGRVVETLRAHRGIAIVDANSETIVDDGLVEPAPPQPRASEPATPLERRARAESPMCFPTAAYEACLTDDQADAVAAMESLFEPGRAVVLEANRGRGKSSAAGIAAGCFAFEGSDVLVTAPAARNATELFARTREIIDSLERERPNSEPAVDATRDGLDVRTAAGGRVKFRGPDAAVRTIRRGGECPDRAAAFDPDIVVVDEAAALPVSTLEGFLEADRVAFATTIHGYEGAGRGFSVRFRDRLEEASHEVVDLSMTDPIRYAAGDPLEVWSFRALGLDARPPVAQLVDDATPDRARYRALEPSALLADESLLREAFGLLVQAHYRTEPNDLARLLDAPNLAARALTVEGHVVSVALLASEGGLGRETRTEMYEGGRVRGNLLPDVLASQLRDEDAGEPSGLRVIRIATHHAARSRGLGSALLERIRGEFGGEVDWLGTAFGATPGLLEFWGDNGFGAVHVSTTKNAASGEHSAFMLVPTSERGRELADRHAARFVRRLPAFVSDSLADLDPDVIRAVLRTVDASPSLALSDHEWRIVAGAAYGPGQFDVDPGPFRELVCHGLVGGSTPTDLAAADERLLVARVLQGREWESVAELLEYHSASQCRRALGDALIPLVDAYGTDPALEVRDQFS
ncbi:tRNA(Met) cytidine acetyltransferase [Halostagnicola sp. A56]|uniref:tRNA(Met) cytidine acetyltransferase TmcA n=1 Tax=Halostagnicola sp. A56 TaxID=1495067 RepID=UPI0004A18F8C|nr:tRNA(Met) cytidine acetyltransferase TmcA [Halostagnicola sp. A56]KDE59341.1 tRNA(Met) cytidine acetyltransferase [Halostagnicola sp. A56]